MPLSISLSSTHAQGKKAKAKTQAALMGHAAWQNQDPVRYAGF